MRVLAYQLLIDSQDIQNEQPWMHVSIAYDETQAVNYAAAALGGLQVARKALLGFLKYNETYNDSRHL